ALPRAAFLHDLGKANDHFQRMVRAPAAAPPQACWHEQLSVWLPLHFAGLGAWLFTGCDESLRQSVLAAVVGHHLRLEDAAELRLREASGVLTLTMLAGHPDFHATLQAGAHRFALPAPPALADVAIDVVEP